LALEKPVEEAGEGIEASPKSMRPLEEFNVSPS